MIVQVLEQEVYTSRELQIILSRYRKKVVPDRTLQSWRNQLHITPVNRLYDKEDLKILIRLAKFLSRGGTMRGFKTILNSEDQSKKH